MAGLEERLCVEGHCLVSLGAALCNVSCCSSPAAHSLDTAGRGTYLAYHHDRPPPQRQRQRQRRTTTSLLAPPGAPSAPTPVPHTAAVKTEADRNSVTIKWAAGMPNGSPISDYEVYCRVDASLEWKAVGSTPANRYTLEGLALGSDYRFKVRCKNSMGWSQFSTNSQVVKMFATAPPEPIIMTKQGNDHDHDPSPASVPVVVIVVCRVDCCF